MPVHLSLATSDWLVSVERSLPYLAVLGALGAWFVSWRESRRNNRALLRLSEFRSSFIHEGPGPSSFYELEAHVKNMGMQLQDMSAAIVFTGRGGAGTGSIPVPLGEASRSTATSFLRGMSVRFNLVSGHENARHLARMLTNIPEQRPRLSFYSGTFHVYSFPLYSRLDGLKSRWNRVAHCLAIQRRVGPGHDGRGVYARHELPTFDVRSESLREFLEGLQEARPDDDNPPTAGLGCGARATSPFR